MVIMLRIQMSIQPFKLQENNDIELLASYAGTMAIYCTMLYVTPNSLAGFNVLVTILMFLFNCYFLTNWLYLFMQSWNLKNQNFQKLLVMCAVLMCKKNHQDRPKKTNLDPRESVSMLVKRLINKNRKKVGWSIRVYFYF